MRGEVWREGKAFDQVSFSSEPAVGHSTLPRLVRLWLPNVWLDSSKRVSLECRLWVYFKMVTFSLLLPESSGFFCHLPVKTWVEVKVTEVCGPHPDTKLVRQIPLCTEPPVTPGLQLEGFRTLPGPSTGFCAHEAVILSPPTCLPSLGTSVCP